MAILFGDASRAPRRDALTELAAMAHGARFDVEVLSRAGSEQSASLRPWCELPERIAKNAGLALDRSAKPEAVLWPASNAYDGTLRGVVTVLRERMVARRW